jgi:hypothetical protein
MTPSTSTSLHEQLTLYRQLREQGPWKGHAPPTRFSCIEDLVLRHGRTYTAGRAVHEPVPRACFCRFYKLAGRKGSRWIYVEGYAASAGCRMVMPHAWLTRADTPGRAYDVAWSDAAEGAEYLGIPFRMDYVRRVYHASKRRQFGVLEAWWLGFPLVTGETPVEEVTYDN